jgi:transmembrane sensor
VSLRASELRSALRSLRPRALPESEIRELGSRVRSARKRARLQKLATIAAAPLLVFLLVLGFGPRLSPLAFTVGPEGEAGAPKRWIATKATSVPLQFSDGTRVDVQPRSRVRVAELTREGASLNLEQGRLSVSVVHQQGARWSVTAGPYTVRVVGTQFEVSWDGERELFDLSVREGAVKVEGPVLLGDRTVSAAERLTLAPRSEVRLSSSAAPSATPAAPAAAESALSPVPEPSWQAFARRGEHQKALEIVRRRGFERVAPELGAEDLLRLADVARYGGEEARAGELLKSVRQRYPTSSAAGVAAYTLGITADRRGDLPAAAGWFNTYLRERPSGALTREALGRLMEVQERLGQRTQAEGSARRYLERYPTGPHRDIAKRLSGR